MRAAFPPPDYYGASAPPRGPQLAPSLPTPGLAGQGPGGRGRFPRSPSADRRVRHPAIPRQPRQRLRRGPSPWPPQPSASPGRGSDRRAINSGHLLHTGPYPPGLSRLIAYGASSLVPRVCLLVLLAGPGPSGSTGPSRRCQGCFPPSPAVPGSGCPQLRPGCRDSQAAESFHLRTVRWRLVAHNGIDENHRVHRVQRPALPARHSLHDPAGNRADRLPGDLRAVHPGTTVRVCDLRAG